jgi:diguanylate cyclase (GGDEF)-like protein/PAS domain S-box-containing protein
MKLCLIAQALIIFIPLVMLQVLFYKSQIGKFRDDIDFTSRALAVKISDNISSDISALTAFSYNFGGDKGISKKDFNKLSKYYIEQFPDILSIQHEDADAVTDMIFPLYLNEKALGKSIKGIPEMQDALNETTKGKIAIVDNPYNLTYLGHEKKGISIINPIFKEDKINEYFVCTIDLDKFLNNNITSELLDDYAISLYDSNGKAFFKSGNNKGEYTRKEKIRVQNKEWKITVGSNYNYSIDILLWIVFTTIVFIFLVLLLLKNQLRIFQKDRSIDKLRELKEELYEKEERYRLAMDGANDVIWEWDINNTMVFFSDKWTDLTGYELEEKKTSMCFLRDILHPNDVNRAIEDYKKYINGEMPCYQSEFRIKTSQDKYIWLFVRGKALKDADGNASKISGSITDITDRRRAQEKITRMAYYDSLTDLPNRGLFKRELEDTISCTVANGSKAALLFIDLDNFKNVNDTLGHDYGDKVLKMNAKILKEHFKEGFVARLAGDEFTVLIKNVQNQHEIIKACSELINVYNNPFELCQKHVYVSSSIGIALIPDDGVEENVLFRNADTAMYRAKASGKNRYCFFDKKMRDELMRKTNIEKHLRQAIKRQELSIYYQPQMDIKNERLRGFEALLRWKDNEIGDISPVEFIPIAEETGLIIPIGEWVLKNVCNQIKEWKNKGYDFKQISVNISSIQLQEDNFLEQIKKILNESHVLPKYIKLEITETALIGSMDLCVSLLKKLREYGFEIALDDFGTGYSYFNYLKYLPINDLKIDKSFIDNISESYRDKVIVETIIEFAKKMDFYVVAEGIETKDQLDLTRSMGCDAAQGFYYSKPLPPCEVESMYHI